MSEISDGNHDGRRWGILALPALAGFVPVVAEYGVGRIDKIGKRNVRFYFLVDVVLNSLVRIDVVEAGFEVFPEFGIVANDNARSFDQSGFDGVIQAEIADDPLEQCFLAAALAGGSEGRGGQVEAGKDAAGAMDAIESADPFSGFFKFFFCNALES